MCTTFGSIVEVTVAVMSAVAPLSGVRVLDLSRLLPGPYATQVLADLGAEVLKVEDPVGGDYTRHFPPYCKDGTSVLFHAINRGKKSVSLDLKVENDVNKLHKLLADTDVLVETFRPGVMRKLGLDLNDLHQRYPRLVICSISGFGQTGPNTGAPGHDLNYLAKAGVLGMMENPQTLPVQVADVCGGSWPAVCQILAGLLKQRATGLGSVIDVSMTDSAHSLLVMPLAMNALTGEQVGNGKYMISGNYPAYTVYDTKDGRISVGCLEPKFWNALAEAADFPDELTEHGMSEGQEGARARKIAAEIFGSKTNSEWQRLLEGVDTCVEVLAPPETAVRDDPQLSSRNLSVDVDIKGDRLSLLRTPINMTHAQPQNTRAPGLGEHNEEVFQHIQSKL